MTRSKRRLSTPTCTASTAGSTCTAGGVALPCFVHVGEARLDRARHQFADPYVFEEDVDGAGIGPGHLEEVGHHALEATQVVAEELQRALGARGNSSRSASSTSTEADSVVRGERSSWLTSELKRASRSMRSCNWSTMALKE